MADDAVKLLGSETVELMMSTQMICKNCAYCAKIVQKLGTLCKNTNVREVEIKKSVCIETTRLHEIARDCTRLTQKRENGRYE